MYKHKLLALSRKGIFQISNLLNLVFFKSPSRTYEFLDWEYNQNPIGKAVGFNTYHNNELVAHYVTQPIISYINGEKTKGLLSLNTAVHPEHRGKKLFTELANMTYNYAKDHGYKFVIGVANAASTHGFIKRLGFQLIKPLDVKYGLGELKIDQTKKDNLKYYRYWNKNILTWRLANPLLNYKIYKYKNDHFAVAAPTKKYGIYAIIGYFSIEILPEIKKKTSRTLNPIKIWMGMDKNISWEGSFFFNFPNKLKPSPLNLIFKNLSDSKIQLHPEEIKFHSIDFDAY